MRIGRERERERENKCNFKLTFDREGMKIFRSRCVVSDSCQQLEHGPEI